MWPSLSEASFLNLRLDASVFYYSISTRHMTPPSPRFVAHIVMVVRCKEAGSIVGAIPYRGMGVDMPRVPAMVRVSCTESRRAGDSSRGQGSGEAEISSQARTRRKSEISSEARARASQRNCLRPGLTRVVGGTLSYLTCLLGQEG